MPPRCWVLEPKLLVQQRNVLLLGLLLVLLTSVVPEPVSQQTSLLYPVARPVEVASRRRKTVHVVCLRIILPHGLAQIT